MGAGQSLGTVVRNSAERGLAVRDLYPIARCVVEGFINAAFFTTQPVEVSQRALALRHYAAWKHSNRVIGTGDFMMTLGDDPSPKATAAKLFPDFAGRGQETWCSLDAPSKINRRGQVVQASGGAFLGAYGGIYAVSSEIIHGSVYGMSYFMSAYKGQAQTTEAFQHGTEGQMVDILSAVGHAASGFISAYANVHRYAYWYWRNRSYSKGCSRYQLVTPGSVEIRLPLERPCSLHHYLPAELAGKVATKGQPLPPLKLQVASKC